MSDHKCYNIKVTEVVGYSEVSVEPKCNGWAVINKSDVVCTVNGVPLNPSPAVGISGESYGVAGNANEIYKGRITITFAAGATRTLAVVIQKFFID